MKKTLLLLFLSTFSITFAQTDLFTALKDLGTDTEYKVYNISKSGDGYELDSWEKKIKFEIINNKFDKPAGLTGFYSGSGKEVVYDNLEYKNVDHYSKPAFLRERINKNETHLVVDSIVYMLWNMEEDGSSFTIKRIYLPKLNKKKEDEEGKKLTMKEKMAATKNSLKDAKAEMNYLTEIKKMDHEQKIKDYIAEMKAVQPPYTEQEKKEIAEIQADFDRMNAEGKKKNDEFWASEEGQRKLNEWNNDAGKPNKWTVVNNTSSGVDLGINGQTRHLNPGDQWSISCLSDVYYMRLESTIWKRVSLVGEGKTNCGRTINLE